MGSNGDHKRKSIVPRAAPGTTHGITARRVEALASKPLALKYEIAHHLGISPSTFYDLLTRRPDLKAAIDRGRAKAKAIALSTLFDVGREGNVFALIKWLEFHERWTMREDHLHAERAGEIIDVAPTAGVILLPAAVTSSEEWERRADEYRSRTTGDSPPAGAPVDPVGSPTG